MVRLCHRRSGRRRSASMPTSINASRSRQRDAAEALGLSTPPPEKPYNRLSCPASGPVPQKAEWEAQVPIPKDAPPPPETDGKLWQACQCVDLPDTQGAALLYLYRFASPINLVSPSWVNTVSRRRCSYPSPFGATAAHALGVGGTSPRPDLFTTWTDSQETRRSCHACEVKSRQMRQRFFFRVV